MISRRVALIVSIVGVIGLVVIHVCTTHSEAVAKDEELSPYEAEIKPLTTAECAQCHYSYFEIIRTAGGKHQIDCVQCHTLYHVYSPRKDNYDEIMPKCAACHLSASGGPFHGENEVLIPCLSCHANPHAPLRIPMPAESSCALCHTKVGDEIKNYPSKHQTDVGCTDCHAEKHGYIPTCGACHESHSPAVELTPQDCMGCHPVHKPTQMSYAKDTNSAICAGCHGDVASLLQKSLTKHTDVACADCHPAHKEIPPCSRCHGEPHPKMKVDVTQCGSCHGIAHDLAK
jgi:predicted CXXCH cytochrome family protein